MDRARASRLSAWIAIALTSLVAARAVQLWIAHVGCERTWDDGAVQLARDVHSYAAGGTLYADFRKPPYYALEYGPTVPVVMAAAQACSSGIFGCLRAGRVFTIGAALAAFICLALIAGRIASPPATALAALGFFLTPIFFQWYSEFRVDIYGLLLDLAGLYAFGAGAAWLGLILFELAFLTKHTFVAGIAGAVGLLWWERRRRRALWLGAGWLLMSAAAVFVLQRRFPFLVLNTVVAHVPLWDWTAPPQLLGGVLLAMALPAVMAAAALRRPRPELALPAAYTAAALVLGGISTLRWGSDYNYLIEFGAGVAILSAAGFDRLLAALARRPRLVQGGAGVALALAISLPAALERKLCLRSLAAMDAGLPAESCVSGWDPEAMRTLARLHGPILTALPDISLRIDGEIWSPEFDVLRSMRSRGLFDDHQLVELIERKKFAAIVLNPDGLDADYRDKIFLWPRLREAIVRNYTPASPPRQPSLMLPRPR